MRDPFYPAGRRMKWYIIISVIIGAVVPFLTIGRGLSTGTETDNPTVFESAFTVCLISLFFIFAIYSSVEALRLTTRPGISREMRKHFAYSHIIYITVYLISWMVYYFAAYYFMFYVALFGNNF
jgi:uncharacterized membrane protein